MPQVDLQASILAVTGKRLRSPDRQKQLQQMIRDISDLSDDDWIKLPPEVQAWYEGVFGGRDQLDKTAKIKDFRRAVPTQSVKEDTVAKSKSNGKQRKVARVKAKTVGAPVLIRRMLNKNPRLSAEELYKRLVDRGSSASKLFVGATRSIHVATQREMAKDGLLNKEFAALVMAANPRTAG